MVNIVKAVTAILCVTCFSGCTGLSHLMYNYMCNPYGPCSGDCQQPHPIGMMPSPGNYGASPAAAPEALPPAVSEEVTSLQSQVETLTGDNAMLREKLSNLDMQSVEQKKNNNQLAQVMGKVTENLRIVSEKLDQKELEYADLATRVQAQRDRGTSQLADLEEEVNDLLSQLDEVNDN